MIELIIVAIVIASIWFFLKFRKKQSDSTTPQSSAKTAQSIKTESKPAEKTVTPIEIAATPVQAATPAVKVENKPVTQSVKTVISENNCLPQDSMLRRHYLTNLRTIITSLNPAHPTDSALSRHYETQIAANIEHCLNNEAAMTQLLNDYNACKKTTTPAVAKEAQVVSVESVKEEVQTIIEPTIEKIETVVAVVASSHKASKIPEDSALRRHYMTHLYAQVATTLAPRPTDATLRRHYDALLESEVKKQLAS